MGGVRSVFHLPVSSDGVSAGVIRFGAVTRQNLASGSTRRIVARCRPSPYLGSHMARIVLKRLAQGLFIVWLTTSITFFLVHAAPGEPFAEMLTDPRMSDEMREANRARYGLDQPVLAQYLQYVRSVATGDLGQSFTHQRPVMSVLADALPRTLLLMGTAIIVGFAAGIVLGALQGARAGGWFDRVTGSVAVLFTALPDFWLALLAVMLFAGTWLPVSGFSTPTLSPAAPAVTRMFDVLRHLVLPAGTLAILISATVSRYQRAALIDVLPSPWLRTARAKGLSRRPVVFRHALRNAVLPVITLAGLSMPALLGGAVFIEMTFSRQGMGSLAVQAVADRDYPVVLAAVLLSSALVVAGAALADLAHAAVNPRQRRA
jgi:peptide/nickel transport system permease protein